MRKIIENGYGGKTVVVFNNTETKRKNIDYKISIGGIKTIVVSYYEKANGLGWNKISTHTSQLN